MYIFVYALWILGLICILLYLYSKATLQSINDGSFKSFQKAYLVVYLLAAAGDWLQGPHVYALYDSYGMATSQIEILFVAGFGSSMVFGTVIGSFADKYGRRANCLLYGVLYGAACITKHFANFWVLMLGRLLGGMATSILFSAFESWLIFEHNKRGFDDTSLSVIFAHATLGNSVVAVLAGFAAQVAADQFGFVAPFDVSLGILIIMCLVPVTTWSENYGDQTVSLRQSFAGAFKAIRSDSKIFYLGVIQALFEGAMYTFVLEWTPALTPPEPDVVPSFTSSRSLLSARTDISVEGHRGAIPHGYIFSAFMISVMIGSSLFRILNSYTAVENFMRYVLVVAAMALTTPILFPSNQLVVFTGFVLFEVCVGIFWPSMGTMRGKYVPEDTRATIMNCFRIPLNLIVVIILLQNLPISIIFQCCVLFLLISAVCQYKLFRCSLLISLSLPNSSSDHFHDRISIATSQDEQLPSKQLLSGDTELASS